MLSAWQTSTWVPWKTRRLLSFPAVLSIRSALQVWSTTWVNLTLFACMTSMLEPWKIRRLSALCDFALHFPYGSCSMDSRIGLEAEGLNELCH